MVPLDHIEGMRGVLMFQVLLIHVRLALFYPMNGGTVASWFRWATLWTLPAFYSMGVFFVISGYCLMLPVARSEEGRLRGGVGQYLKRRARRLLLPYYAALTLSVAAVYLLPSAYVFDAGISRSTPGAIWSHLLLIHNLRLKWHYLINAPLWYVAAEWQMYLLFPLLLLPLWRRFGMAPMLAVALVVGLCPLFLRGEIPDLHPWYVTLFAIGMAAACIQFSNRPQDNRWLERIDWGRAAGILFGAFAVTWVAFMLVRPRQLLTTFPYWRQFCLFDLWVGVASAALIIYCGQWSLSVSPGSQPAILKLFNHPWSRALGVISYSNFLVHFPLLMAVRAVAGALHLAPGWVFVVMYLVAIPISLSLGYLFYLGVERHFLPGHRKTQRAVVFAGHGEAIRESNTTANR
jgi:peptidoglycan/LPS O-acetylase OafA/YrhL